MSTYIYLLKAHVLILAAKIGNPFISRQSKDGDIGDRKKYFNCI
jgi:hypothetical protein